MEIQGLIIKAFEPRGGVSASSGKPWKRQQYVLQTVEQYPRHVCFEVSGVDRIANLNIQEGQILKVHFDIDAHEYQGRWYNQIDAWKVEPIGTQSTGQQTPQPNDPNAPF